MKNSVVILGGGLSGLSVALGFAGSDYEVHIIEKESEVGGLGRSFIKNGYVFDHGPHFFYTKDPEIFYRVKKLMGDDLLTVGEMYSGIKIFFEGKQYDYPLKISTVLKNMKFSMSLKCLIDYLKSLYNRALCNPPSETFEDWIINHFGKSLYEKFFKTYTQKTWGVSPQKLAANFASERIPRLSIRKIVKEIFRKEKKQTNIETQLHNDYVPKYSYYFSKGCWELTDVIRKEIESSGVKIHFKSRIKRLIAEDGHISKVIFENNNSLKEIRADYVVTTIPINELIKVCDTMDKDTKDAGSKIRYRELTFLFLGVTKPKVFDSRIVYFHDPAVIFNRITEMKHFSANTVPAKDKTGLILEITNKDNFSDEEIYEKSVNDLEKMHFLLKKEVEMHHIIREPYAYPIYDIHYKGNLDILMNGLFKFNNLIPTGRQALFRYIDMDLSIKMGLIVSRHILDGKSLHDIDKIVAQWS